MQVVEETLPCSRSGVVLGEVDGREYIDPGPAGHLPNRARKLSTPEPPHAYLPPSGISYGLHN
jgi:hypothetical protein